MSGATPVDAAWRAANPLPVHVGGTDKNSRGRVLAVGGSAQVPGALRLTGEAALRAGAGKLQMAVGRGAAPLMGMAVPEAAVIALDEDADGEIAAGTDRLVCRAAERCDALVVGPGIGDKAAAARLVELVAGCARDELSLVLDAVAVACAGSLEEAVRAHGGRCVLTPHHGEMASLTGREADAVAAEPEAVAAEVAARYGAVVVLKDAATVIAAPDGTLLGYDGGGVGLATGGSGDVLAGVVAGLLSRGAEPLVAAGWAVWLHGEAGRVLAARHGPVGLLARELLPELPRLLPR